MVLNQRWNHLIYLWEHKYEKGGYWNKLNFVSVLTVDSIVLLYSWILLLVVSIDNIAFMDYRILLSMLKYKYVYAVTDWLRNYEQIPIIIVIYKLCCIFFNVFKTFTCSTWSVNVQLNIFTSFFYAWQHDLLICSILYMM